MHKSIAGREGFAVVEEDRRNVGLIAKLPVVRQYIDIAASQHEPLIGEFDGRRKQHRPRQGAVFLRAVSRPMTVPGTPTTAK